MLSYWKKRELQRIEMERKIKELKLVVARAQEMKPMWESQGDKEKAKICWQTGNRVIAELDCMETLYNAFLIEHAAATDIEEKIVAELGGEEEAEKHIREYKENEGLSELDD